MKNKRMKFYTILSLTLLVFLGAVPSNVSAKTKAITPYGWRFPEQHSTYVINKQSKYYKSIWKKATNAWTKAGFKWTKASSSKTHLLALTQKQDKTLIGLAGVDHMQYNTSNHLIVSNKVELNKTSLKKYNYTTQQKINVAEHELGHALGLKHNLKNSKSVMNPANRIYSIEKPDIRGMKKAYSKSIANLGDSISNNNIVSIDLPIKLNPRITHFHMNYSGKTHKLAISGHTYDISNLNIKYNKQTVKNYKVKKNGAKFKIILPFKGYKDFTIYSGKHLIKTISASKYATNKPTILNTKRNKNSVELNILTKPGNIIKIWEHNKPIFSTISDIPEDNITLDTNENNNYDDLRLTQHERGKKTSKMIKLPKLDVGNKYQSIG
ncbi:matrixin family metalloprotease [Lactobacillus sp. ESL0703]|uniref:M12 family metallo-peptidase n=1 Tax=Lactobacillus sp. ESL0703 TaxID=2983218 RepID=UPI0023F90CC8|nr:matrixin family metalloprotease [Lactobacillus sp. ESL0703]MDF7669263.1 M12 family metallo-peptidase [Lactobacillus sp. ESL0703]